MARRVSMAVVAALALAGCDDFPEVFVCDADAQCIRAGATGQCRAPGYCAFVDPGCASGARWDSTAVASIADQCVDDSLNVCGGMGVLPETPGTPCGACGVGMWRCEGLDDVVCDGEPTLTVPVTATGRVDASTEFSLVFHSGLAVDTDLTTSWFSSGPEGVPTRFEWVGARDDCIASVSIVGNGNHRNVDFRTGYGFGEVTVQVRTADDEVASSEVFGLTGEPDPTVNAEPMAYGRKVVLLFTGHEADDCGGFAELTVNVLRP